MALSTKIIATEINNLSDARYFSAFPVDWLTFVCNPSSTKTLSVERIQEIVTWIEGPKIALDVRGCSQQTVEQLFSSFAANGIIVDATQQLSAEIREQVDVFTTIYLTAINTLERLEVSLATLTIGDSLILDFSLNDVDLEQLFHPRFKHLVSDFDVYVQAPLNVKDVSRFLELNLSGLALQSGHEEKVGIRSFDDVQDLMEELVIEE